MTTEIKIITHHDEVTDAVCVDLYKSEAGDPIFLRIVMQPDTGQIKLLGYRGLARNANFRLPVLNMFDLVRVVLNRIHEEMEKIGGVEVPFLLPDPITLTLENEE